MRLRERELDRSKPAGADGGIAAAERGRRRSPKSPNRDVSPLAGRRSSRRI
jgi:hypothetical protein